MIPGPVGGLFNVFIERPRSTAPGAAQQLANAIAVRYGIAAGEVERRLAIGRFRVKGNVDRATADEFAGDLARLGAIVTVEPVEGAPRHPAPAVAVAPVSLQQPRIEPPPKPSTYSSGLAAASSAGEQDLGALSGEVPLTLSMLDGADDSPSASGSRPLPASFGPPASPLPASFGPPPESGAAGDAIEVAVDDDEPAPAAAGGDMFAPPESGAELQLALDVAVAPRTRRPATDPPAVRPGTAAAAPDQFRPGATVAAAPPAPVGPAGWKRHARDPRVRYVAGVVLCAALGLVPATVFAAVRERSAFADLDGELREHESKLLSRDQWDNLDRVRAGFAERKRAERQSIAITSLLLWAAAAGGLAYVWFRVIDWDRVLGD